MMKRGLSANWAYLLASLACLCGVLLARPAEVAVDVIPQGKKTVSYCFTVANVSDFPDYTVLAHEQPPNPSVPATVHVIDGANCLAARFSATFHAMKRAEFSPGLIPRSAARSAPS